MKILPPRGQGAGRWLNAADVFVQPANPGRKIFLWRQFNRTLKRPLRGNTFFSGVFFSAYFDRITKRVCVWSPRSTPTRCFGAVMKPLWVWVTSQTMPSAVVDLGIQFWRGTHTHLHTRLHTHTHTHTHTTTQRRLLPSSTPVIIPMQVKLVKSTIEQDHRASKTHPGATATLEVPLPPQVIPLLGGH